MLFAGEQRASLYQGSKLVCPQFVTLFLLLHFQHVLSYSCYASISVFPTVLSGVMSGALFSTDLWWCPSHGFHLLVFWPSNWLLLKEWCAFILVPWIITLIYFLFQYFLECSLFFKYSTLYFTECNGRASPNFLSLNKSVNRYSPSNTFVVKGDLGLLKCSKSFRMYSLRTETE